MAVYLLCFSRPFYHARHYVGFCESVEGIEERIISHQTGRGSRLMKAITDAGISIELTRMWAEGDRNFERTLKKRKCTPWYCPRCRKEKSK